MSEHLPECPILQPCCDDEENPDHGFCGNFVGRCLHCMAECICEALLACEERVITAALQRVQDFEYVSTIGVTLSSVIPKAAVIAAINALREDSQ